MKLDPETAAALKKRFGIIFFPRVSDSIDVLGSDVLLESNSQHRPGQFMPLGSYSYSRSYFGQVSRIGRYCSIGANVTVMGESHPTDWISTSPIFYRPRRASTWQSKRQDFPHFQATGAKVEIGNDVWIGDDVLLATGVNVGTGAIIAARSIVTSDVPPYAIVGGSPAKHIRWRFDADIIDSLLLSEWWDWPVATWDTCDPQNIEAFLAMAEKAKAEFPKMPDTRIAIRKILQSI